MVFLRGFFCASCLSIALLATPFVLNNHNNLLIPKSVAFIETLSSELKYKTGFSFYVDVVNQASLNSRLDRKNYENSVVSKLASPYGILFFFRDAKKIDIVLSSDSKTLFNVDNVFFDYIAPLLPEKDSDLTPQRVSAVIVNGYSQVVDKIAEKYGVKLENNFATDHWSLFARIILYIMLFILVSAFMLIYFFKRHTK